MSTEDDDGRELPSPAVQRGSLLVFVLVMVAAPFVLHYWMSAPSLWKTVIGEVRLKDGTSVRVGRMHDGEFSYDYYVMVRGENRKPMEWRHLASSSQPVDRCVMATTEDGRFTGVAVMGDQGVGSVMYDAVEDELSRDRDDNWERGKRFDGAWRELRKINPALPEEDPTPRWLR